MITEAFYKQSKINKVSTDHRSKVYFAYMRFHRGPDEIFAHEGQQKSLVCELTKGARHFNAVDIVWVKEICRQAACTSWQWDLGLNPVKGLRDTIFRVAMGSGTAGGRPA